MVYLIVALLVVVLNGLYPLIIQMFNGIVDVVFNPTATILNAFQGVTGVMYNVGLSLIVLKFLKKGFEIYVLWSDGDPDQEPVQLLINFGRAIIVAIAFKPVYNIFIDILKEIVEKATKFVSIEPIPYDASMGIITALVTLVAFIIGVILYIKAIVLGINMLILNIGMPLACTGLLDNDKGVFRNYFQLYVKTFCTVLIQVIVAEIGMTLTVSATSSDALSLFTGVACLIAALSAPKLLSEFLVPSSPGGGGMGRIYSAGMMIRAVKSFVK